LEEFIPTGTRTFIDFSVVRRRFFLREKPFRAAYSRNTIGIRIQNIALAIDASEAILPAWATLLITAYLSPFAQNVVLGSLQDLENSFFETQFYLDLSPFEDKPIMIKGCSDPSIPRRCLHSFSAALQTVAKSLFYGEACSSVPLWKAKK